MMVGFAGSGNMAAAIARGLVATADDVEMLFTDAGSGRAAKLAEETGGEAVSAGELAERSELIILAVKPAALESAAEDLSAYSGPLVSLLGATSLAAVEAAFAGCAVLRAMPNVAVEVGRGVICFERPSDPDALAPALELLGRLGELVELPDEQIDLATAVMGCAPAYLALACEALIEAGATAGLDEARSRELVSLAAAGLGELLLHRHPADIRRAVASPGGSTEAGLAALAERDTAAAFAAAVEASLARMRGEL